MGLLKCLSSNICPDKIEFWESGHWDLDGNKNPVNSRVRLKELLKIPNGQKMYFNTYAFSEQVQFVLRTYDENKNFIRSVGVVLNGNSPNLQANEVYLGVSIFENGNTSLTFANWINFFATSQLKPYICSNDIADKTYEPFDIREVPHLLKEMSRNMLDIREYGTKISGGVTLTSNLDGTITLNGVSNSAGSSFAMPVTMPKKWLGKTLTISNDVPLPDFMNSGYKVGAGNDQFVLNYGMQFYSKIITQSNIDNTTSFHIYIKPNSGTINLTLKLKVEHGTVAKEYEPFQEPRNVKGRLKGMSSNLLKKQGYSTPKTDTSFYNQTHANFTPLSDGWGRFAYDNTNGSAIQYINAFINIAGLNKVEANTDSTIFVEFRNVAQNNGAGIIIAQSNASELFTNLNIPFTQVEEGAIFKLLARSKADLTNVTLALRTFATVNIGSIVSFEMRIMIVPGNHTNENLSYEEYKEPRLVFLEGNYLKDYNIFGNSIQNGIPTPDNPIEINSVGKKEGKLIVKSGEAITEIPLIEPLRGLPNGVRDDLDYKNIGEIVFNGSENWVFNSGFSSGDIAWFYKGIVTINTTKKGKNDFMCENLPVIVWGSTTRLSEGIYGESNNNVIYIGIAKNRLISVDPIGVRAWLAQNPITLYYVLATPTPQNITRPQIPYFGQSPELLNEVRGETTYEV